MLSVGSGITLANNDTEYIIKLIKYLKTRGTTKKLIAKKEDLFDHNWELVHHYWKMYLHH